MTNVARVGEGRVGEVITSEIISVYFSFFRAGRRSPSGSMIASIEAIREERQWKQRDVLKVAVLDVPR